MSKAHGARKHSKFSASGADRWTQCPGSVALSEGLPDKSSLWAEEGTKAHEVLEALLKIELSGNDGAAIEEAGPILDGASKEMIHYGMRAANFLSALHYNTPYSEFLIETRIHLDFIHPDMFGTFDSAIVEHFGTLHVFDYKFGAGHAVSPKDNLQMIFYGLGLAHRYDWNFKRVRLWIVQPRIRGYDGPAFWEIPILELKKYVDFFKAAVERVENSPDVFFEGDHCKWCKAKAICPLKRGAKISKARNIFLTEGALNGGKEKSKKEESCSKEEKTREAQAAREKQIEARIERAFAGSRLDGDRDDYF